MSAGAIAGIVIGVLATISILLIIIFWYKSRLDLSSLPPDVRWFYEKYSTPGWTKEGKLFLPRAFFFFPDTCSVTTLGTYFKAFLVHVLQRVPQYTTQSRSRMARKLGIACEIFLMGFVVVTNLEFKMRFWSITQHSSVLSLTRGEAKRTECHLLTLCTGILWRRVGLLMTRVFSNPKNIYWKVKVTAFCFIVVIPPSHNSTFLNMETAETRMKIYSCYEKRVNQFSWNLSANTVPIIPAVHGTSFSIAKKICSTGFASLSILVRILPFLVVAISFGTSDSNSRRQRRVAVGLGLAIFLFGADFLFFGTLAY